MTTENHSAICYSNYPVFCIEFPHLALELRAIYALHRILPYRALEMILFTPWVTIVLAVQWWRSEYGSLEIRFRVRDDA